MKDLFFLVYEAITKALLSTSVNCDNVFKLVNISLDSYNELNCINPELAFQNRTVFLKVNAQRYFWIWQIQ